METGRKHRQEGRGKETAPFTVILAAALPRVKVPAGSIRHSVSEVNGQLGVDYAPVLAPACPFSGNVRHGQIEHFQQAVIGGENGLGFGHLAQPAVEGLMALVVQISP